MPGPGAGPGGFGNTGGFLSSLGQGLSAGLPGILYGMFGNPGRPYEEASQTLSQYLPQAQQYQNPFYNMGVGAIPQFQQWTQGMQNPTDFINKTMGQYQESPWAKYQQEQALRAGQNMGSATGLTGSTPLAQFLQENARNISSQDMNQWLQNVLGVNTTYGQGLQNQIAGGQGAANALTNLMSDFMTNQALLDYGKGQAEQGQWGGLFQGLGNLFGF